jgi:hypothetical protein
MEEWRQFIERIMSGEEKGLSWSHSPRRLPMITFDCPYRADIFFTLSRVGVGDYDFDSQRKIDEYTNRAREEHAKRCRICSKSE